MNKILSAFIQEHNLTYDNKEKMFYGFISGYQMSGGFSMWTSQNVLSFHVHLPEERLGETNQFFVGISKTYGIQSFNLAGDGIVCVLFTSVKKYVACAEAIANYLSGIGAKGGCPFCEEDLMEGARLVGSSSGIYRAHERCFDEYVEKVKGEEAAYKAAPAQMGKAVGGMVLGVLAGAVVWVLFYILGFISFWAPIVSGFLGAFLWDKFGGKNDKVKIIVLWVATIVILALTIFFTYYVTILNAATEAGFTFAEAWDILMADADFVSDFIQDTVVSAVFILLADVVITVQVAKTQKLLSKTFRKF